ncbi:hypothetical protein SHIRM173S_03300 [Streptomyces hirsutus]
MSCRTLSGSKTWKNTKVTKAIVPATVASPSFGSGPGAQISTASVPAAITVLASRMRVRRCLLRIRSSAGRGLRFIASGLTGSTPRDMAGGPSMTRLTNRICRAVNGAPPDSPVSEAIRKVATKPRAVETWNRVNFTMLS